MERKRPQLEPIRAPTLFPMEKLEEADKPGNSPRVERPYFETGIYLGTSSFTAAGWEVSFYPQGMKSQAFLGNLGRQIWARAHRAYKISYELRRLVAQNEPQSSG